MRILFLSLLLAGCAVFPLTEADWRLFTTLVRFDPADESFQSWAIPSGGVHAGIVNSFGPRIHGVILAAPAFTYIYSASSVMAGAGRASITEKLTQ